MKIECLKCHSLIAANTSKVYTKCMCGAIAVDGCEYYTRIIGNKEDYRKIEKGGE